MAYAYLKRWIDRGIVGDVWLYNRCPAPERPEWTDKSNIPFALSREFIAPGGTLTRELTGGDIAVDWVYEGERPSAYVYVLDDLYGIVGPGDLPGYSRFASKASPLGRLIETYQSRESVKRHRGHRASFVAGQTRPTQVRGIRRLQKHCAAAGAHKKQEYPDGFKKAVSLPSGQRMDAYNEDLREAVELKPDNPRAVRRGEKAD